MSQGKSGLGQSRGLSAGGTPWPPDTPKLGELKSSLPAVDVESLASDKPGFVGAKKCAEGRDFTRLSSTANWNLSYAGIDACLLATFANRVNGTGNDTVDQDAVGRQLGGQRPGESDDTYFGSGYRDPTVATLESLETAEIYHPSSFSFQHSGQRGLGAYKCRVQVGSQSAPPVFVGHFSKRHMGSHCCVVNHGVDVAELG